MFTRKAVNLASFPKSVTVFGARKWPIEARLRVVPHFSSGIIISRASETRAHVKITKREKGDGVSPFLTWGDFHARSRFARSTIPEQKWGTTRSLRAVKTLYTLSVKRKSSIIVYEGSRTGRTRLENSWISEFFSTRSKCLKFFFIHFGPGKSLTFDRGTFSNLQNTLAKTRLKATE